MKHWRIIEIDGERFLTRASPCNFLVRHAKRKNGGRKGDYYLDNNKMTFRPRIVLGTYRCLGVFKDKKCTKRVRI